MSGRHSRPVPAAVLASTAALIFSHRVRITAGVPGCTCGIAYPAGSHSYYDMLHSRHLARIVAAHLLDLPDAPGPAPAESAAALEGVHA